MDVSLQQSPVGDSSKQSAKRRRRRSKKQDVEQPEVGNIIQTSNDLEASEKVADSESKKDLYGTELTEKLLSETLKTDTGSIENLSEDRANRNKRRKTKKARIQDEVQRMELKNRDQIIDTMEETASGKLEKDLLEKEITEQPLSENPKIDEGSVANISECCANRKKKKKKKKKKKATIEDEVKSMVPTNMDQMNYDLKALYEVTNTKPKKDTLETDLAKQPVSENRKINAGSPESLSEEFVNRKKKRKKKRKVTPQVEFQSMGPTNRDQINFNLEDSEKQANGERKMSLTDTDLTEQSLTENPKIEPGSIENLLGECQNRKKKKRKKKKNKATVQDEVQCVEQTNMHQMNHDVEASEVGNSKLTKDLFVTDFTSQPLLEIPKIVACSEENLRKVCANRKKKRKKKKKGTVPDEVQKVEPRNRDQMDDSLEAFENVSNCKLKKDISETDLTQQTSSEYPKIDGALIENIPEECVAGKKKKKNKMAIIQDEVRRIEPTYIITGSTENPPETAKEHIEKTEIKEVQTQIDTATTENLAEANATTQRKRKRKSCKKSKNDGEADNKTKAGSMLNSNLTDENHEYMIDGELRNDDTNQESELPTRKEDQPCGSEHNMNGEALYPKIGPSVSARKKLLVLDVNGLLADIIMCPKRHCSGDTRILGRSVHRRPFCDDFLKFCFQNFDVGIWSSRSTKVIHPIVNFLFGDLKKKLLFCWDMLYCTQTGLMTLENRHKPLVCKELRKIWGHSGRKSPWKKGDYNKTNTLLLDDSPYKALLNPSHTAIFPYSYSYLDKEKDKSLGPGGHIRAYLEGLTKYDNVQKYVEQHPFGQKAISKEHSSWGFYKKVLSLKKMKPT